MPTETRTRIDVVGADAAPLAQLLSRGPWLPPVGAGLEVDEQTYTVIAHTFSYKPGRVVISIHVRPPCGEDT